MYKKEGLNSFTDEDAVLWDDFRKGSYQAFSAIYQSQIQALFKYGMQLTKDSDLVEDCIHDLFVYLWDTREKLGQTDNIKFYLFRSLRRRIAATQKGQDKENALSNEDDFYQNTKEVSHEERIVLKDTQEADAARVTKALSFLTKRQKEAVYLRFYDNLSFQEIAEVMSLSLKSTYNLLSKALEILRQYIHLLLILALPGI